LDRGFGLYFSAKDLPKLGGQRRQGERWVGYPDVTWLQYALLPFPVGAVLKGPATFGIALATSWVGAVRLRRSSDFTRGSSRISAGLQASAPIPHAGTRFRQGWLSPEVIHG
jgi:hypothetical protein